MQCVFSAQQILSFVIPEKIFGVNLRSILNTSALVLGESRLGAPWLLATSRLLALAVVLPGGHDNAVAQLPRLIAHATVQTRTRTTLVKISFAVLAHEPLGAVASASQQHSNFSTSPL